MRDFETEKGPAEIDLKGLGNSGGDWSSSRAKQPASFQAEEEDDAPDDFNGSFSEHRDVLLHFSKSELQRLHDSFQQQGDSLDAQQFQEALSFKRQYMQAQVVQYLHKQVLQLYSQLEDPNKKGVSWEALSAYAASQISEDGGANEKAQQTFTSTRAPSFDQSSLLNFTETQAENLKEVFQMRGNCLDLKTFGNALAFKIEEAVELMAQHIAQRLGALFEKLDVEDLKSVNWDGFSNFLMLRMKTGRMEISDSIQDSGGAAPTDCLKFLKGAGHGRRAPAGTGGEGEEGHADMICSIQVLGPHAWGASHTRYVTGGRDGFVRVWNSHFQQTGKVRLGRSWGWVTDLTFMTGSQKLVAACSAGGLAASTGGGCIFVLDSSVEKPSGRLDYKDGIPCVLSYFRTSEGSGTGPSTEGDNEILFVGDDLGHVTTLTFTADKLQKLFDLQKIEQDRADKGDHLAHLTLQQQAQSVHAPPSQSHQANNNTTAGQDQQAQSNNSAQQQTQASQQQGQTDGTGATRGEKGKGGERDKPGVGRKDSELGVQAAAASAAAVLSETAPGGSSGQQGVSGTEASRHTKNENEGGPKTVERLLPRNGGEGGEASSLQSPALGPSGQKQRGSRAKGSETERGTGSARIPQLTLKRLPTHKGAISRLVEGLHTYRRVNAIPQRELREAIEQNMQEGLRTGHYAVYWKRKSALRPMGAGLGINRGDVVSRGEGEDLGDTQTKLTRDASPNYSSEDQRLSSYRVLSMENEFVPSFEVTGMVSGMGQTARGQEAEEDKEGAGGQSGTGPAAAAAAAAGAQEASSPSGGHSASVSQPPPQAAASGGGGGGGGGGTTVRDNRDATGQAELHKSRDQAALELQKQMVTPNRRRIHTDLVTKVGFVPDLPAVVSSSLDGTVHISDLFTLSPKYREKGPFALHKRGVLDWSWCSSRKFFASAGVDRLIFVWNPFTLKALHTLSAHQAPVRAVVMNEPFNQMISLGTDKILKVWDIRSFTCTQSLSSGSVVGPEDTFGALCVDPEGPSVIVGGTSLESWVLDVQQGEVRSHVEAISSCVFNRPFNQVVSADRGSTIKVWSALSGKLDFLISEAHGNAKVTAMCFDPLGRRLLTSGDDGLVRMWNGSSGICMQTFRCVPETGLSHTPPPPPRHFLSLTVMPEGPNHLVTALGSNGTIFVWPQSKKQQVGLLNWLDDPACHGDETSLLVHCEASNSLVSAGEGGLLYVWKVKDETSSKCLRFKMKDTNHQTTRHTANTPSVAAGGAGTVAAAKKLTLTGQCSFGGVAQDSLIGSPAGLHRLAGTPGDKSGGLGLGGSAVRGTIVASGSPQRMSRDAGEKETAGALLIRTREQNRSLRAQAKEREARDKIIKAAVPPMLPPLNLKQLGGSTADRVRHASSQRSPNGSTTVRLPLNLPNVSTLNVPPSGNVLGNSGVLTNRLVLHAMSSFSSEGTDAAPPIPASGPSSAQPRHSRVSMMPLGAASLLAADWMKSNREKSEAGPLDSVPSPYHNMKSSNFMSMHGGPFGSLTGGKASSMEATLEIPHRERERERDGGTGGGGGGGGMSVKERSNTHAVTPKSPGEHAASAAAAEAAQAALDMEIATMLSQMHADAAASATPSVSVEALLYLQSKMLVLSVHSDNHIRLWHVGTGQLVSRHCIDPDEHSQVVQTSLCEEHLAKERQAAIEKARNALSARAPGQDGAGDDESGVGSGPGSGSMLMQGPGGANGGGGEGEPEQGAQGGEKEKTAQTKEKEKEANDKEAKERVSEEPEKPTAATAVPLPSPGGGEAGKETGKEGGSPKADADGAGGIKNPPRKAAKSRTKLLLFSDTITGKGDGKDKEKEEGGPEWAEGIGVGHGDDDRPDAERIAALFSSHVGAVPLAPVKRMRFVQVEPDENVTSAFSDDLNRFLVLGTSNGSIAVWDIRKITGSSGKEGAADTGGGGDRGTPTAAAPQSPSKGASPSTSAQGGSGEEGGERGDGKEGGGTGEGPAGSLEGADKIRVEQAEILQSIAAVSSSGMESIFRMQALGMEAEAQKSTDGITLAHLLTASDGCVESNKPTHGPSDDWMAWGEATRCGGDSVCACGGSKNACISSIELINRFRAHSLPVKAVAFLRVNALDFVVSCDEKFVSLCHVDGSRVGIFSDRASSQTIAWQLDRRRTDTWQMVDEASVWKDEKKERNEETPSGGDRDEWNEQETAAGDAGGGFGGFATDRSSKQQKKQQKFRHVEWRYHPIVRKRIESDRKNNSGVSTGGHYRGQGTACKALSKLDIVKSRANTHLRDLPRLGPEGKVSVARDANPNADVVRNILRGLRQWVDVASSSSSVKNIIRDYRIETGMDTGKGSTLAGKQTSGHGATLPGKGLSGR